MAKKTEASDQKKRVAIYCRVSTYEQGKGDFSSLKSQESIIREYCKSKGWDVIGVYADTRTGATLERTELKRLETDAADGKFDIIAVTKLDRISRSVKDFLQLDQIFIGLGIEWAVTTQNIDTTTPAGKMQRTIMLAFAEFERDMIAERTREKLYTQAQKGYWGGGYAPLGYDVQEKKLIVNDDEKKLVQLIYQLYLEHSSIAKVTDIINERGYRTKVRTWQRTNRRTGGTAFSKSVIKDALKNPLYLGMITFKKEQFKGLHDPIIEEVTFNQVQKKLAASANDLAGTHHDTPLELLGTIKCGFCTDKSFTSYYTNKGEKRYFYYKCTTKTKISEKSCESWNLPADALEKFVRRLSKHLTVDKDFFDAALEQMAFNSTDELAIMQETLSNKKRLLEKLERDENNLVNAIKLSEAANARNRLMTELDQISTDKQKTKEEILQIEETIQEKRSSQFDASILKTVLQDYDRIIDTLPIEQRQIANRCLFNSITSTVEKNSRQGFLDFDIRGDGHLKTSWDNLKASGWKNWERWLLGQDSNLQPIG